MECRNIKKLIAIVAIILIYSNAVSQIKQDKLYHIYAGLTISEVTYVGTYALWKDNGVSFRASMYVVTCSAFGKEMYDCMNGGVWNWDDAKYTILSGTVNTIINYAIIKLINRNKKIKRNRVDI